MISVSEAKKLIGVHTRVMAPVELPLAAAAGLMLAEEVIAGYDIPAYPQSSMDGYAFAMADAPGPLRIIGEMAAGSTEASRLAPGTAMRIFTGAALPEGADTILIQEKAVLKDGLLHLTAHTAKQGDHVRPAGSEIIKGDVALPSNTLLQPPAIGFLAAIGVSQVRVIPSPRICIVVTGNELIAPGTGMGYGKVYEASSFALKAASQATHVNDVRIVHVKDDLQVMSTVLADVLQKADLVLMTGGVSVGDHDHTVAAANACGIKQVFHKLKQKPGKPLFFGVKDDQYFFGLPGNPASVLTCFYEYVLPCISIMTGRDLELRVTKAKLQHAFRKPAGLTHFLRGHVQDGTVQLGTGQESYKLRSFALANCLVMLPEEVESLEAGAEVDVHLLPSHEH